MNISIIYKKTTINLINYYFYTIISLGRHGEQGEAYDAKFESFSVLKFLYLPSFLMNTQNRCRDAQSNFFYPVLLAVGDSSSFSDPSIKV